MKEGGDVQVLIPRRGYSKRFAELFLEVPLIRDILEQIGAVVTERRRAQYGQGERLVAPAEQLVSVEGQQL